MRIVIQNADFSSVKIGTEIGDELTPESVQNRGFLIHNAVSFGYTDVYDVYCYDVTNLIRVAIENAAASVQSDGIIALFCTGAIPPSKSWPNSTGTWDWINQYLLAPKTEIVPDGWESGAIDASALEYFNVPAGVTRLYVTNRNDSHGGPLKVFAV